MSKTRNKSHSELEYLRGRVKKLESELRRCKKQLKHFERRTHHYEGLVDDISDEISEKREVCQECGKGTMVVYDFKFVKVTKCDTCDFQLKRKRRNP